MLKRMLVAVVFGMLAYPAIGQDDPTMKRIASTKTFALAHRDASVPLSFLDSRGRPVGYQVDICLKIAEAVKEELKLDKLEIKYVPVNAPARIPTIVSGQADIECGSSSNTLTRQRVVGFTMTTFTAGTRLLVRKGSGIKSIEDLNGKRIALLTGSTNEKHVAALAKQKNLTFQEVRVNDHSQAMLAMDQERADAYPMDDVILAGMMTTAKNPAGYEIVGPNYSYEPYAMIIAKNAYEFRTVADRAISKLYASGEMEKIYAKWFLPGPTNINFPMSTRLKALTDLMALPE
jgi:glutamate/aspartate transport system substrate-binding protein